MKGIILAGGKATRLQPVTDVISKQLLPICDKPMIYYPLSMLILAGIRDIMLISTPQDLSNFKRLLGDGSNFGIKISYAEQDKPRGLADAFIIGKDFIGDDRCCLILGDNIFYGHGLPELLKEAIDRKEGATIFAHAVKDPERSGVVEFDKEGKVLSIEEKPLKPKSKYAIVGLYFFDNEVVKIASKLTPSARGELEIVDIQKAYLEKGSLYVTVLGRGFAWLDTGTFESLVAATSFIQTIQESQNIKICCPEEIAFNKGFISKDKLIEIANKYSNSGYGEYLLSLIL